MINLNMLYILDFGWLIIWFGCNAGVLGMSKISNLSPGMGNESIDGIGSSWLEWIGIGRFELQWDGMGRNGLECAGTG